MSVPMKTVIMDDYEFEIVDEAARVRVPEAPTTSGTYVLKAVVTENTPPTYAWVSEES